jgi:GNAT superfamily N-acetyltransferase
MVMIASKMLTSQTTCEMTAVPGGIIECVHIQPPLITLQNFSKTFIPLSSPLQIDRLNRSITLTSSPLSYEYKNQIMNFETSYSPLLKFLKRDAFIYEEVGNTCTTLFFEDSFHDLVGFCSTKCSSLKLEKKRLLSLCPTIEIATLCISDKYRYLGIGQAIMHHTIQQIYNIKKLVGIQLVTLFSLPKAVPFYQKLNFRKLAQGAKIFYTPAHECCIPMYLALPHITLNKGDSLPSLSQ